MSEITREKAIALAESEFWKDMTHRQRAVFQLNTELLCMPFDVFHEAIEKALGRPVWTHELVNKEQLCAELYGDAPPPSLEDIMSMIPADKRIIVETT